MRVLSAPPSLLWEGDIFDVARSPDVTRLLIPPPPPLPHLSGIQTSAGSHRSDRGTRRRSQRPCPGRRMWLIVLASFLHCASAYDVDLQKLDGLAKARVEVKAFVVQDIPLYHNLVMKHLPGADPELVLLNHYYEELDRIALSDMTRSEINELLQKLGFYKKAQPEDEVPDDFRFAPAKDSPFKDERPNKSASALDTENASSESDPEVKHTDL